MSRTTICLVCGVPTLNGSRCPDHGREGRRRNPAYDSTAWRKLRRDTLAAHRAQHGDLCPGYRRAAHPSRQLTVDHITPLAAGGSITGPVRVLCASCHGSKTAREDGGYGNRRVQP